MRYPRLCLVLACLIAVLGTFAWMPLEGAGERAPEPGSCGGTNLSGACCVSGVVRRGGVQVAQGLVTIQSERGRLVYKIDGDRDPLSYAVLLSEAPLHVRPGDTILISAEDGFGKVAFKYEVEPGEQTVDIDLDGAARR